MEVVATFSLLRLSKLRKATHRAGNGRAFSEVLVLGGIDADGKVRLLRPDPDCESGSKVA